jgi:hypothetical protein
MNQIQPDLYEAQFGHRCARRRLGTTQIASSASAKETLHTAAREDSNPLNSLI